MKVPPMELSFPGTKVLGYESSSYPLRHHCILHPLLPIVLA